MMIVAVVVVVEYNHDFDFAVGRRTITGDRWRQLHLAAGGDEVEKGLSSAAAVFAK